MQTGDVRQWDDAVMRMARDGNLRLRQVREDEVLPGRSHERFDQCWEGVRVFGGDLTRQLQGAQTASMFGVLYAGIDLDPTPVLSADEARKIAVRTAGAEIGLTHVPELLVLPLDGGGYALTYRIRVMTDDDLRVYFVDAK